jgi:hypothetical protein
VSGKNPSECLSRVAVETDSGAGSSEGEEIHQIMFYHTTFKGYSKALKHENT